jgi:hypothetical protein
MVCSTFSRSGWSVVRGALFTKGGTSKKRPSPHLHKVPTRSNKVSPRTLQTALVFRYISSGIFWFSIIKLRLSRSSHPITIQCICFLCRDYAQKLTVLTL